jgi:hypothetical protein
METGMKRLPLALLLVVAGLLSLLTERLALSEDGKTLVYSGVLEDPLAKPVEWSGKWEYHPTMKPSGEKCNVEVASRFLRQEK